MQSGERARGLGCDFNERARAGGARSGSRGAGVSSATFCVGILAVCGALLAASAPAGAPGVDESVASPYPVEYWALRDVISNVEVSPSGERLALLRIPTRDGNPVIEVYDTANLAREPFRVNAAPMEITGLSWVSDDFILFSARQKVRDIIDGYNEGVYGGKFGVLDVAKKAVDELGEGGNVDIASVLPGEPDKVVLALLPPGHERNQGVLLKEPPRDYYEYDLRKGTRKLLVSGKEALAVRFDAESHPWMAIGRDLAAKEVVYYHRPLGTRKWLEFQRRHEDDFEEFHVVGFDVDDRKLFYVIANNGHDKAGLWELDVETGEMATIYRRPDVDVWNAFWHSNAWTEPDRIAGVSYVKDRIHREFFDEKEANVYRQLAGTVPHAWRLSITSRSRDGQTLTIHNIGPRDPGTYYLFKDDRLETVGSAQPLLASEALADVRYITYKARDGKIIPAFLTVPNGKPPFPLVVMPHGGPFIPELVDYDKWGQLLANNGYLVLQPQYRGSRNYGLAFYKSAFIDGSEAGRKMQDDKDDGALHLVKEGMAARDRLAMFGWSYGGYAAGVAAARTPQIYQCVAAGAAVFDPVMQVNYYRFSSRGAQKIEQLTTWDGGVSPLKVAEQVNVPMLIVHGSVDQRVPPAHVRKYLKRLDDLGKPHRYLELEGADHWIDTLFYDHQLKFYTTLLDFLANDCGPGGL